MKLEVVDDEDYSHCEKHPPWPELKEPERVKSKPIGVAEVPQSWVGGLDMPLPAQIRDLDG